MAKKGIEDMIEDLEYFIENCKVQAFSSNKIVAPRDELLKMVREIKMKLPSEIDRCNKIMENRDAVLADARKRADDILAAARDEAQRKVSENEIMQIATEQARELITQATNKSKEIIDMANEDADTIRIGALNYTNGVMEDLSEFTSRYIQEEGSKYQAFVESLQDTYHTIETNRAQITSQLNSGKAPDDNTKIQQKEQVMKANVSAPREVSEVEKMHSQENHSARPGFTVPEVGVDPEPVPVNTSENAPVSSDSSMDVQPTIKTIKTRGSDGKSVSKTPSEEGASHEDELDELDELYLDEY